MESLHFDSDEILQTYEQLETLQAEIQLLLTQEQERVDKLDASIDDKVKRTLGKIPEYREKLRLIGKMMASVAKRSEKLKKRATIVQQNALKLQAANKPE